MCSSEGDGQPLQTGHGPRPLVCAGPTTRHLVCLVKEQVEGSWVQDTEGATCSRELGRMEGNTSVDLLRRPHQLLLLMVILLPVPGLGSCRLSNHHPRLWHISPFSLHPPPFCCPNNPVASHQESQADSFPSSCFDPCVIRSPHVN